MTKWKKLSEKSPHCDSSFGTFWKRQSSIEGSVVMGRRGWDGWAGPEGFRAVTLLSDTVTLGACQCTYICQDPQSEP